MFTIFKNMSQIVTCNCHFMWNITTLSIPSWTLLPQLSCLIIIFSLKKQNSEFSKLQQITIKCISFKMLKMYDMNHKAIECPVWKQHTNYILVVVEIYLVTFGIPSSQVVKWITVKIRDNFNYYSYSLICNIRTFSNNIVFILFAQSPYHITD